MKIFKRKIVYDERINFNDELLFVHIPKTGGTSIAEMLQFTSPTHIKAKEIFSSQSKGLLRRRFSFSLVRHPIHRFISLYNYARMDVSHYHNNLEPEKATHGVHLDYKLLKRVDINECVELLVKEKLKHDRSWNQWEPQYTWLFSENDRLLVKRVYKLEALGDLEKELSKKLGKPVIMPKLNSSLGQNNSCEKYIGLTKESMSILMDFYRKDFELLGY